MAVYLLRYDQPAGDPDRPRCSARYYLGYSEDTKLPDRIRLHRQGLSGASLPTWFHQQGIDFRVVRIWWGQGRKFERRLKQAGHYERHDPTTPEGRKRMRREHEARSRALREKERERLTGKVAA